MSLLNLFEYEIMHVGGIAKAYEMVCAELYGNENESAHDTGKRQHIVKSDYSTKIILELYKTKSIKFIAEKLGTNYSMVQARIKELGLKKPMIRPNLSYIQKTCKIMNIETGKIFENMSIAARSENVNINTFIARIKKFGCYKKFIKVA